MAGADGERDARMRRERRALLLLAAAAIASLLLTAVRVAGTDRGALHALVVNDDGYYYAEWARRVAAGEGPTFDGFERTDGVRPVWALSLVPIYTLVSDRDAALRIGVMWSALLHVACIAVLARALSRRLAPGACALAGAIGMSSPPLALLGAGLMDWSMTALLAVSLAAAVAGLLAEERASRGRIAGCGALVALNLLGRPESLLLVLLLAGAVALRRRFRDVLAVATVAALLMTPVVIAQMALFGRYGSIAGELKAQLAWTTLSAGRAFDAFVHAITVPVRAPIEGFGVTWPLGAGGAGALLAAAAFVAACLWFGRGAFVATDPRERAARDGVLVPLLAFAALHSVTVAVLLHAHLDYGRWYLGAQDVAVVALLALLFDGIARRVRARTALAGAAALVALQAFAIAGFQRDFADWRERAEASPPLVALAAEWLTAALPPDTRIGAHNAGYLAYHTPQPVTNLDGLMNSRRFAAECIQEPDPERRRIHLLRYIAEERLAYLVDPWPPGVHAPAILFGDAIGPLVAQRFEIVATFGPPQEGGLEYQVYRVDLGGLTRDLAARGLVRTGR